MKEEKAYKLLAIQEGISNNEAKELIDSGLVYAKGQKLPGLVKRRAAERAMCEGAAP